MLPLRILGLLVILFAVQVVTERRSLSRKKLHLPQAISIENYFHEVSQTNDGEPVAAAEWSENKMNKTDRRIRMLRVGRGDSNWDEISQVNMFQVGEKGPKKQMKREIRWLSESEFSVRSC